MVEPGDLPVDGGGLLSIPRSPLSPPSPEVGVAVDDAATQRWDTCRELNLGVAQTSMSLARNRFDELLAVSASYAAAYTAGADLRRLNIAAKALGPCWWYATHAGDVGSQRRAATVMHLLTTATDVMREQVAAAVNVSADNVHRLPPPVQTTRSSTFHALTGGRSGTLSRFLAGFGDQANLLSWCAYSGTGVGGSSSMYAKAWAPARGESTRSGGPLPLSGSDAKTWDDVADWLDGAPAADAILLFGMPIVPEWVLRRSTMPVINAHNGTLPGMRGLDALAWSVALGEVPTATAHRVVGQVDAGQRLARAQVPLQPLTTVADRLKGAQCTVLAAALSAPDLSAPAAGPEGVPNRYFGRMHPYLRRILDQTLSAAATP